MQINKFSVWLSTNKRSEMMIFPSIFIEILFSNKNDIKRWYFLLIFNKPYVPIKCNLHHLHDFHTGPDKLVGKGMKDNEK